MDDENSNSSSSPLLPLHGESSSNIPTTLKSLFTIKNLFILSGPLLCTLICVCVNNKLDVSSRNMLGVLAWVFAWWLTEAVPMPITSMSPLFLFPLFGIAAADDVARSYMDDVISLVLGSFILALAVEHYNIHTRLALNITLVFCRDPVNPQLLLLGICGTTAFVSMWMHNTATTIMMMPVATGILQRLPSSSSGAESSSKFCKAVVLGVIYSAAVGGMSTLTGTGVNLILVGMWKTYFPQADPLSFSTWFFFGFPMALLLFFALWVILCLAYCPKAGSAHTLSAYLDTSHIKRELDLLGPMAFAEKMVLGVFSSAAGTETETENKLVTKKVILIDTDPDFAMDDENSNSSSSPLLPLHGESSSNIIPTTLKSLLTIKNLFILSGPLLCTLICVCVNNKLDVSSRNMLGVLAWVFAWWLTEAVPMPITSMSPLFLFPLFGIAAADDVARSYMDDVISLVLGSFILALAVEHYNIHTRLALNITLVFCRDPVNPQLLLLGICGTTAFVSMWMHNTATTIMMMPVATGILQRLPSSSSSGGESSSNFCKAVVLGILQRLPSSSSSGGESSSNFCNATTSVGGMSTLTGTGVNLILVGMWKSYFPQADPLSFSTWFFFGFPMALLLFFALWVILCLAYCPKAGSAHTLSAYLDISHIKRELDLLGPMAFAEKMVLGVFSALIVLWMTRSITDDIPGWGTLFNDRVGDGTVSVMMATLLFIIPNKKQQGEKLMDWNKCKKLPWNIVLLLGAGLAIAEGVRTSGVADVLSRTLDFLGQTPYLAIAPAVCVISGFMTELITSNNATTTILLPLLIEIAKNINVHPLLLMVPGAIGAQFAFLLPTATPSNVIGFTTGHIDVKDMVKAGLPLKFAGTLALSVLMPSLGALVFVSLKTGQQY
ncbi:hypothetical protein M8C21_023109 [Ambrosia artemisiifolia]|uniref:Tonoplast dicarboxylate transporter n=1 Tax=Ambrosia artemisiifolia TaxID=4212 RepID=A0AAD5GUA6_AMBAR|nr:hypothetical protein M8C21_023109 [Ambrosia artemisiifolia]